ncbi:MAG TPA: methionyl aminopeptidase [Chlamydiales bacterium]|nr:methionyl aminopeptidase [Chlamydiales bacterium]
MGRNDPCWCQSGQKWKKCHYPKLPLNQMPLAKLYLDQYGILLKTPEQIVRVRKACKITKIILQRLVEAAKQGVTTEALDELSMQLHREMGATPASLGYGDPPFPKSICTSLNEVICHGIPDNRPLQEGDILNIDVASIVDGYFGDCSQMVTIGKISEEKALVVRISQEALAQAIDVCRPGNPISFIGKTIEDYARANGCSVVNQFVGHGVGISFHEPPEVPHHYNSNSIELVPGMTFTIEPMINAGVREAVIDKKDRWTARTKDGKPSAQWEETILITETGYEVLTR